MPLCIFNYKSVTVIGCLEPLLLIWKKERDDTAHRHAGDGAVAATERTKY